MIVRQHDIFKGQISRRNNVLSSHKYSTVYVMEHFTVCQECHVVASDTGSASMQTVHDHITAVWTTHVMEHFTIRQECHIVASDTGSASMQTVHDHITAVWTTQCILCNSSS